MSSFCSQRGTWTPEPLQEGQGLQRAAHGEGEDHRPRREAAIGAGVEVVRQHALGAVDVVDHLADEEGAPGLLLGQHPQVLVAATGVPLGDHHPAHGHLRSQRAAQPMRLGQARPHLLVTGRWHRRRPRARARVQRRPASSLSSVGRRTCRPSGRRPPAWSTRRGARCRRCAGSKVGRYGNGRSSATRSLSSSMSYRIRPSRSRGAEPVPASARRSGPGPPELVLAFGGVMPNSRMPPRPSATSSASDGPRIAVSHRAAAWPSRPRRRRWTGGDRRTGSPRRRR